VAEVHVGHLPLQVLPGGTKFLSPSHHGGRGGGKGVEVPSVLASPTSLYYQVQSVADFTIRQRQGPGHLFPYNPQDLEITPVPETVVGL